MSHRLFAKHLLRHALRRKSPAQHRIHRLCRLLLHVREDMRIEGSVMLTLACPNFSLTTFTGIPRASRSVAAVWRRSCSRMRGSPARSNQRIEPVDM
jgi:hypothetical protein